MWHCLRQQCWYRFLFSPIRKTSNRAAYRVFIGCCSDSSKVNPSALDQDWLDECWQVFNVTKTLLQWQTDRRLRSDTSYHSKVKHSRKYFIQLRSSVELPPRRQMLFTNRSLSDTRCQLRSQLSCTSVACQMSTCEINRQLVLVPKLAVVCRSADKYTNVKIYQHFNHTTHPFTTPPAKWACPRGVSVSVSARYWPAQVARCSPNIVTHVKGCEICTSGFP